LSDGDGESTSGVGGGGGGGVGADTKAERKRAITRLAPPEATKARQTSPTTDRAVEIGRV
jgi:hypothetical protein